VSHFTAGFVALRTSGVVLQARKYVRDDGRTVVFVSHVPHCRIGFLPERGAVGGEQFGGPPGRRDGQQDLLTNQISYKRAAKALHLAEQHEEFKPPRGRLVPADVDVQEFTSNTIAVLNLVTLVHSQGVNPRTLSRLLQFSPSAEVEQELLDDLC